MNKNQVLSFTLGLLSGAIVGAAAFILLAPQSGLETRQRILDSISEIIDAGRQAIVEQRRGLEREYKARILIPLPPAESETA